MERSDCVVIGAGHAGLAVSQRLGAAAIDHVVLDRADVANAWRTERWDSLRLLTPNWMSRLPGWPYTGPDPDGYMTAAEVSAHLVDYGRAIAAPVRTHTDVRMVTTVDDGFVVSTGGGPIGCRSVVVATGACSDPRLPAVAAAVPARVQQIAPVRYRNPGDIADGRVLVVGASASGVQLAEELALAGREVVLAVGAHTRVPRTYRGRDIHAWLDALGILDQRHDEVDDLVRARRRPSLQLVGSTERRSLDLARLRSLGVRLVGRLAASRDGCALFSGSLAAVCTDADLAMARLLDQIDERVGGGRGERPPPTVVPEPPTAMRWSDLGCVVWATGYRPMYPWLEPDLLDQRGAIVHDGGVMRRPGLYVLGLPFARTRKSSFLDGAAADAAFVVGHLRATLDRLVDA